MQIILLKDIHSEWFNGWLLHYWDLTVIARVSPTDCRGVGACLAWIREIEMLRQSDCHNHEPGCDNHGVDFLRPATARESLQLPTGVVVAKPVKVWKRFFQSHEKKQSPQSQAWAGRRRSWFCWWWRRSSRCWPECRSLGTWRGISGSLGFPGSTIDWSG